MFGNAYKVVFKTSIKYYEIIAEVEDNTRRIVYQRDYTEFTRNTMKTSFTSTTTTSSRLKRISSIFPTAKVLSTPSEATIRPAVMPVENIEHELVLEDEEPQQQVEATILPVGGLDSLPILTSAETTQTNTPATSSSQNLEAVSFGSFFNPVQIESNIKCLRASANGACLECDAKFHLFDGECYNEVKNCKIYDSPSTCRKCHTGFTLQNNSCIAA